MDGLALLMSRNRNFSSSCALCFRETWLCGQIPDSALHWKEFQQTMTQSSPARPKEEVDVSASTMAGVATWLWSSNTIHLLWNTYLSTIYKFYSILLSTRVQFIYSAHCLHPTRRRCTRDSTRICGSDSEWSGLFLTLWSGKLTRVIWIRDYNRNS